MKTTHTHKLHLYAGSEMFCPVSFTTILPTVRELSFTTSPIYSNELRCAITVPPARLSAIFPLTTSKSIHVNYHPYCLKSSHDISLMNSFVDL